MSVQDTWDDQPVGEKSDALWRDDPFRGQLQEIADRIAAPLRVGGRSRSITFAIHGSWGAGKSSALKLLREMAEQAAGGGVLASANYPAPIEEARSTDVRTSLITRILHAVTRDSKSPIDDLLGISSQILKRTLAKPAEQEGRAAWISAMMEQIATDLGRLPQFDEILSGLLERGAKNRVLLVLVDDLDRCDPSFVMQVLREIQHLSAVDNVFFVLAVDEHILREAVRHQPSRVGASPSEPERALEKYVQRAIRVPKLDEESAAAFYNELTRGASTPAGEPSPRQRVYNEFRQNFDLLYHGLLEQTPRSIKRCMNTISYDLIAEINKPTRKDTRYILKKQMIAYSWADFYERHLEPALDPKNRVSPLVDLETMAQEQRTRSPNTYWTGAEDARIQHQLEFLAQQHPLEPFKEIPLPLVKYMGLDPALFEPELTRQPGLVDDRMNRSDPAETGKLVPGEQVLPSSAEETSPDSDGEPGNLERLYVQVESAAAAGSTRGLRQKYREIRELVERDLKKYRTTAYASLLGNVAVSAEQAGVKEEAEKLYELAEQLDPDHVNNLQNYVDFVVNARIERKFEHAREILKKLKNERYADQQSERTYLLELRLARASDPTKAADRSRIQEIIDKFLHDPKDSRRFRGVMLLANEIDDTRRAREIARAHCGVIDDPSSRAEAIRALADLLAASNKKEDELEAMQIYFDMLPRWREEKRGTDFEADVRHNLATLYFKHDFEDEAGKLWFDAYAQKPGDSHIRRGYSLYLLRAGHNEAAQRVANGQPLTPPPPLAPHKKSLPSRFTSEGVERWWNQSSEKAGGTPAGGVPLPSVTVPEAMKRGPSATSHGAVQAHTRPATPDVSRSRGATASPDAPPPASGTGQARAPRARTSASAGKAGSSNTDGPTVARNAASSRVRTPTAVGTTRAVKKR